MGRRQPPSDQAASRAAACRAPAGPLSFPEPDPDDSIVIRSLQTEVCPRSRRKAGTPSSWRRVSPIRSCHPYPVEPLSSVNPPALTNQVLTRRPRNIRQTRRSRSHPRTLTSTSHDSAPSLLHHPPNPHIRISSRHPCIVASTSHDSAPPCLPTSPRHHGDQTSTPKVRSEIHQIIETLPNGIYKLQRVRQHPPTQSYSHRSPYL